MSLLVDQNDWQIKCPKVKKRTTHLYNSREWSDCTFMFDPQPNDPKAKNNHHRCAVPAHKLILSIASPVFGTQFYGSIASEDTIIVTDIDRNIFERMLRYMYTDEIRITDTETALDLYYAAKKYLLEHLQDYCIDYVLSNLNPDNVCYIYEFACFNDEPELKEKCLKVFKKKTLDVLKSSNFVKANVETVKLILSLNQLTITSELDLFDALLQYADTELKNSNLAEKMANTLCTLYKKYSTKASQCSGETVNIDSSSTSNSESETEERPSVSSVVLPKNTVQEKPQDKASLVRQLLRPCVALVRFLTLTPRQFAESARLAALLTPEEIMAVSMNVASKETAVPMPEGFSRSRVPRGQLNTNPIGTMQFTINNILQVKKFTSEVFCAKNIPWSVSAQLQEKRKSGNEEKQTYLRVDIDCMLEKEGAWTVPASYTVNVQWSSDGKDVSSNYPPQKKEYCFSNTRSRASMSYTWNRPGYPLTFKVTVEPLLSSMMPRPKSAYEIWRQSAWKMIRAENPRYTEAQVTETVEVSSVIWNALLDKSEWEKKAALSFNQYMAERRNRMWMRPPASANAKKGTVRMVR